VGWMVETVDGGTERCGNHCNIALDSQDRPHISYTNSTDLRLRYAHWDGAV